MNQSIKKNKKSTPLLLQPLRYGNEYGIEYRRLYGKHSFFNWSLLQSRSYNRMSIDSCRIKDEPMYGGGAWVNGYAARHSPPKWEGRLAI